LLVWRGPGNGETDGTSAAFRDPAAISFELCSTDEERWIMADGGGRDVVTTLNDLIETCKDGQSGYRKAADFVSDTEMQALFDSYSLQRTQFINDLQAAVRYFGGIPANHGSATGAVHRGWIDLKSRLSGDDEEAILSECERGEQAALHNYEEALQERLPAEIMPLMEYQYWQVREAHERIRALDAARK
jgi:uncharacterized protein (TIGR02284 family)